MQTSGSVTARVSALVVAMLMAALVTALAIVEAISDGEVRHPPGLIAPWADHILAMDDALAAGDTRTARWAYHEAYNAARGSRRWEAMADLGDAAVRLGDPLRARTAYLTAAFRARAARAVDGVLRAVEGFAALGDEDVAVRWLRQAEALGATDSMALRRARAAAARLGERSTTAEAAP